MIHPLVFACGPRASAVVGENRLLSTVTGDALPADPVSSPTALTPSLGHKLIRVSWSSKETDRRLSASRRPKRGPSVVALA